MAQIVRARSDGDLAAARGVLRAEPMEVRKKPWEPLVLQELLRRLRTVVEHHRYHGQSVDARQMVALVLAEFERSHQQQIVQYRATLEEAVRALLHDIR